MKKLTFRKLEDMPLLKKSLVLWDANPSPFRFGLLELCPFSLDEQLDVETSILLKYKQV